jgi:hypothetical protein
VLGILCLHTAVLHVCLVGPVLKLDLISERCCYTCSNPANAGSMAHAPCLLQSCLCCRWATGKVQCPATMHQQVPR